MSSNSNTPKPRLACEFSADRCWRVVWASGGALEGLFGARTGAGSVVPDLVENICGSGMRFARD